MIRNLLLLCSGIYLALGMLPRGAIAAVRPGLNNARSQTLYTPVAFGIGTAPIISGLHSYSGQKVTLASSAPILTLDYGADVAGFPYFEVFSHVGSAVQIELKYSEQFQGLNSATGDGPWYLLL